MENNNLSQKRHSNWQNDKTLQSFADDNTLKLDVATQENKAAFVLHTPVKDNTKLSFRDIKTLNFFKKDLERNRIPFEEASGEIRFKVDLSERGLQDVKNIVHANHVDEIYCENKSVKSFLSGKTSNFVDKPRAYENSKVANFLTEKFNKLHQANKENNEVGNELFAATVGLSLFVLPIGVTDPDSKQTLKDGLKSVWKQVNNPKLREGMTHYFKEKQSEILNFASDRHKFTVDNSQTQKINLDLDFSSKEGYVKIDMSNNGYTSAKGLTATYDKREHQLLRSLQRNVRSGFVEGNSFHFKGEKNVLRAVNDTLNKRGVKITGVKDNELAKIIVKNYNTVQQETQHKKSAVAR